MKEKVTLISVYLVSFGIFIFIMLYLGLNHILDLIIISCLALPILLILIFCCPNSLKMYASRALLLMGSTLFFLLLGDFILRITSNKILYYRPHEMFSNQMPEFPDFLWRYDKNIIYEGSTFGDLAALSGNFKHIEKRRIIFETDSLGFRNKKLQKDNPNQILLLGDSFGVGTGTSQNLTIAGTLLNEFEVYNLSFPGDPIQEFINFEISIDKINLDNKPILFWLLFAGNDLPSCLHNESEKYLNAIKKNRIVEMKASPFDQFITKAKRIIYRSPLRLLVTSLWEESSSEIFIQDFHSRKMYFFDDYIRSSKMSEYEITSHEKFEVLTELFVIAKHSLEKKGIRLNVVLIPTKFEIYDWLFGKNFMWDKPVEKSGFSMALSTYFSENEIEFIDIKPMMIDYAEKQYENNKTAIWWLDDTHLNIAGNKAIAEILITQLD